MRYLFYCIVTFSFFQVGAQNHPTCDGMRYIEDLFDDVSITTGVNYGSGTTFGGAFQQLNMDIYEPSGDIEVNRPLIILAFGGSFIAGTRQDLDWLCKAYAKKGFVVATIDYRLYDGPFFPLPSAEDMSDVVVKSVSDMKAAIRYFREDVAVNGNSYGVDPDHIFVGGISAGSITAAHTAMLDSTDVITPELWDIITSNGGLEGNSSANMEYTTEVQGLINFSGGLNDASWIDENDPPFLSVHDEFDNTVPYGEGFASIFGFDIIYMEGSQIMNEVGDNAGVENKLHTIEGSMGHVSYFQSAASQMAYVDSSASFLFDLLCPDEVVSVISQAKGPLENLAVYPNPTAGLLYLEGGTDLSLQLTLHDVLGRQLAAWRNVAEIDFSAFEKGMYFLEMVDPESKDRKVERIFYVQ